MHDYFEILGVARDARGDEVDWARRRRTAVPHPDVQDGDLSRPELEADLTDPARAAEIAVDFVAMGPIVARMRAAFFGWARS